MGFKVLIISVALVAVIPRKISKPTFNVESTTLSTTLSTTIEIPKSVQHSVLTNRNTTVR